MSLTVASGVPVKKPIRIADLPVYDEPAPVHQQAFFDNSNKPGFLEQKFGEMRQETAWIWNGLRNAKDRVTHVYETGKAHSQSTLDIIRDESKSIPRALFISSGAFVGLIIAARKKGILRRLIYPALGAAIPAAVCYPEASKDLANVVYTRAQEILPVAKKYAEDGYKTLSSSSANNTTVTSTSRVQ